MKSLMCFLHLGAQANGNHCSTLQNWGDHFLYEGTDRTNLSPDACVHNKSFKQGADVVMKKLLKYSDWLSEECDNLAREVYTRDVDGCALRERKKITIILS